MRQGGKRTRFAPSVVALFIVGTFLISAAAAGGFVAVYGQAVAQAQKRVIIERDLLFARALSQGIGIHVDLAKDAMETLAGDAARVPFTAAALQPLLENVVAHNGSIFGVVVGDATGTVVAGFVPDAPTPEGRIPIGLELADRDYFRELVRTRQAAVSGAITSRAAPIPTVAVAAPMFDADGAFIGFVAAGLKISALTRIAERTLGTEYAVPVVVDRDGLVIVHPDAALVAAHRLLADFAPAKEALAGREGFVDSFVDVDGVDRSAAYAPVPDMGWGVWVAQDNAQFARLYADVAIAAVLPALSAFIGITALFILLMRVTLRPLVLRSREAKAIIDSGHLSARLSASGPFATREVRDFTDVFNGVLGSVRALRDRLERASEVKSQFLRIATHAFRTPLTVSAWTIDEMREQEASLRPKQRAQIARLYDATKRQVMGFDNLFAALELFDGTARPDLRDGDLNGTVRAAVTGLLPLAKTHGISLRYAAGKKVAAVHDEKKIRRAVEILVANGIFYSRPGNAVVVALRVDGGSAVIDVADQGIGMDLKDVKRVGEPFFRGDRGIKTYTDGTGLGLYIAKSFLELHGGELRVRSAVGKGTTATIRLPLRPSMS